MDATNMNIYNPQDPWVEATHFCDIKHKMIREGIDILGMVKWSNRNKWTVIGYGNGIRYPIDYCPYCGERLR